MNRLQPRIPTASALGVCQSVFWNDRFSIPYMDLIGEEFVFKFRGKPIPMGLKPADGKYDVKIYD